MQADAVVVGGGVIGLAAAWASARRGLRVVLADPDPGRGASWVAAGMLAPVTEAVFGEEALTALLVAAARRWPAFADELEAASATSVGYRASGTVVAALDGSDRDAVDRLLGYQQSLGLPARRLPASALRALVPALSPRLSGGAEMPDDHQVDNRRLVGALLAACRASGVELVPAAVESVRWHDGACVAGARVAGARVAGVRLAGGAEIDAPAVVLAAGVGCGTVGGVPAGVVPPVRPVKGTALRLQGAADRPLLSRTVRGVVHGRTVYVVPRRDGSVVVGATAEERTDREVEAGAVHQLLDDARAVVPGIDDLTFVEATAGLRPGSPDNAPFVGRTRIEGLVVATGHYRNGILLAPLTADAVAAALAGEALPEAFAPFPADRLTDAIAAGGTHP